MNSTERLDGVAESRPTSYSFRLETHGENDTLTFSMKVQANNLNKFIDIVPLLQSDAKRVSTFIETAIDINIGRGVVFHTFKLSSDCVWLEIDHGRIEFYVPGYNRSITISTDDYIKEITKLAHNILGWSLTPVKPYSPVLVRAGVDETFRVYGVTNNKTFGGYTLLVQRDNFMVLSAFSAGPTKDGAGRQMTRLHGETKKRYFVKKDDAGAWTMLGGKIKFAHSPGCQKLDSDSNEFILL